MRLLQRALVALGKAQEELVVQVLEEPCALAARGLRRVHRRIFEEAVQHSQQGVES